MPAIESRRTLAVAVSVLSATTALAQFDYEIRATARAVGQPDQTALVTTGDYVSASNSGARMSGPVGAATAVMTEELLGVCGLSRTGATAAAQTPRWR